MTPLWQQATCNRRFAQKTRWRAICLLLVTLVSTHVGLQAKTVAQPAAAQSTHCFSCLRAFNAVLLQLHKRYVDPAKFDPANMLLQALLAMERQVAPVMIKQRDNAIEVQVGTAKQQFDTSFVTSIWHVAWALHNIVQFVDRHLDAQHDRSKAEYALVNGMLSTLDDYCVLLDPKQAQELNTRTKGEFGGLGIYIGFREGMLTVISPIEDTPAEKAGVKALDRIVKINDNSTINLSLDEAAQRLRGKPGTAVTIHIKRKGQAKLIPKTIVRAVIEIESVKYQLLSGHIGYIRLKAYDGKTGQKVQQALQEFRKKTENQLKGVILDVRGNPGGLLSEAIHVVSPFLPQHELVVVTQGAQPQDRREERVRSTQHDTQLPLAVLIDGGSASASEIDAGALKDHARAIIMGSEATFGKASVQLLHPLQDQSILKYTIAHYQTPLGKNINSVGIAPDVQLKPVFVDDKKSLQLFSHRLDDNKQTANSAHEPQASTPLALTYIQQQEQKKDPAQDYQIQFARRVLLQAEGNADRGHLLRIAQQEVELAQQQEKGHLVTALKKLGIDWSSGQDSQLQVRLTKPLDTIKAGQTVKVRIQAHNAGQDPIWQLHGVSSAVAEVFAGHEFIFGKLPPQTTRSWEVPVEIPAASLGYHDVIKIPFYNGNKQQLGKLNIPIHVHGLPRSQLASRFFIDNPQGTSDGQLHLQETVHLVMWVKNVGEGTCQRPIVWLKDSGQSNLFVEQGRHVLDPLEPGQEAVVRFVFRLKEQAETVDLKIQAYDDTLGNGWIRELHLPVTAATQQMLDLHSQERLARVVSSTAALCPTAQCNSTSLPLAQLQQGQTLRVQAQSDTTLKVLARADLAGFVRTSDVTMLPNSATQQHATSDKTATQIAYHIPAQFVFPHGKPNALTSSPEYSLNVRVDSTPFLQDVAVFVGNKKQFFQSVAKTGPLQLSIKQTLQLEPGLNWITLVAHHDKTHVQRHRFTIYFDDKNLFGTKPTKGL